MVQPMLSPPQSFTGPRLEPTTFVCADGARLPLRVWPAHDASGEPVAPWAVIVGLHGMNDYSAGFGLPAEYWAAQGVCVYAYDQRGFGASPGRGVWPGERSLVQDLRTACALVQARHSGTPLTVVGESMGGAVAVCAFATSGPPIAERLVLAAPAVWGWSTQPITSDIALWLMAHVDPGARLVAPAWLVRRLRASDNVPELRRMGRDPQMIFATRADAAYGLVDLMQAARERIGRIAAPTLFLYGAHDDLIPKSAAFSAAARLRAAGGRTAYYPDGYHLLLRDLHRRDVCDDVLAFMRDPGAPSPSGASAIPLRVERVSHSPTRAAASAAHPARAGLSPDPADALSRQ